MDLWNSLDPTLKVSVAASVAGVLLYLLQRYWTQCPIIPLIGPDDTTRKKRITAGLLSVAAGIGAAAADGGNFQTGIAAALTAYFSGQTTFLVAEKTSPGGPANK
ncbi:MAG TPA: hypothetical protein PLZ61_02430 [Candidatus Cryosericum sp.]|nr:hypothetical protein [Candidatus Cryosericum sp.]